MVVHVACRGCGAGLKTKDSNVGKRMRCPRCGEVNTLASVVGSRPIESASGKVQPRRTVEGLPPLTTLVALAFVLLAMGAWFQIQRRADAEELKLAQQRILDQARQTATLSAENAALREENELLAAGPEPRYQRAASLLRETRYREAEQAFEDVLMLFPSHELAPKARVELDRVRQLLMDRNLSELGLTVGDPQSTWVREGGQLGLLSPQITLRLRNMGVGTLEGLHLRVDFIATRGSLQEVLGDGLVAVPGALEPGMSTRVTLRSLGTFEILAADGEGRADLPAVNAHVYVKDPGQAFRKVGIYPVTAELAAAEAP